MTCVPLKTRKLKTVNSSMVEGIVIISSFFVLVITVQGTHFPSVYQIIHSVSCTTYQWNVVASGVVNLDSEQGPVCAKEGVFGTTIKPAYSGRVNCTIDSTSGSIGVTVGFCFFNITSSDSGVYKVTTAGTQRNGTIYVMNKPTTPQISPTTVETGRQETLTCTSTSTSRPSPTGQAVIYTWTVNDGPLSDPRFTSSDNTMTINTVRREDKDVMLQCTARENQGLSSDTTGISLNVQYPPQSKPVMTYSTLTYITGSTVTLSCSITEDGSPLATWTWRCGSRTFKSGMTNSVGRSNLTFVVNKTDNYQPCTCTASSSVGSYNQTSDPATLDIQYPPQGKPVMSYSTLTYISGRTVTVSCSITEDGNPQATWTWRCGSRTFNGGITNSVGRSNLTFLVTKTYNNQPCTCTASSTVESYSQTSDPATLDIRYPLQGKPLMSYSTLTYITGSTVTLSCRITEDGNPQATWTWRCGSRTFNSGMTNSVGRSNLTFVVTKTENNQPCTCTASSSVGSYSQTSDPASLDIQYPPQGKPVMTYSTLTYITGSTVTLSCSITEDGNPQATWTWRCGSRTFNSGITNSVGRSNLTFVVTKTDNNQPCTCTASSSVGSYSQTSDPATLDIQYPPEGFPSFNNPVLIHNESNTVTFTCSLTSNGNPHVIWIWTIGTRNFSSSFITNSETQSILRFQISKTENGQTCRCRAVSSQVSYDQSKEIFLDVRYPSVILNLSVSTHIIIENDNVSLNVELEGNPSARITWMNEDSMKILKTETMNDNMSILKFERINCLDTATYKVSAFNGYGNTDSRSVNISILCPPRIVNANNYPQRIVVNKDMKLNVSFVSMGNPIPTIHWYFRKNQTSNNKTLDRPVILTETKRTGKVMYETTLKRNLTIVDFGEYIAELRNSQGNVEVIFQVASAGKPDPPTDLLIDCSTPLEARLFWTSQYNGLDEMERQEFIILYKMNGTINFTNKKKILSDTGWGKNLSGTLTLFPGVWNFKIESQNSIGRAESLTTLSCLVEDVNQLPSTSHTSDAGTVTGTYFAGFATCLLIMGIVYFILLLKRRGWTFLSKRKRSEENTYDAIQGSSRETNTYEDLSTNKQKDSNVYMNTVFKD